ncbi:MAG TPA: hypothetical protein VI322_05830, partial [Candidatus Saccharimonadia bacterium]
MAKTKPKPKSIREKYWRPVAKINRGIALLLMALAVGTGLYLVSRTHAATAWPTTPPAQICGTSQLDGPATAPAGAITVPAGDNSALTPNYANPGFSVAGSTFWFAPGVHTLG